MNEQLDLFTQRKSTPNRLANMLHDRYDFFGKSTVWFTAKTLGAHTHQARRELRDFAEHSKGDDVVISGNNGYCLASLASDDELKHFGNRLISQAKKMEKRGIAALHILHQRNTNGGGDNANGREKDQQTNGL